MSATSVKRPDERTALKRATRRVIVIVLFLNLAVAAAKLGYGWWAHAVALWADGLHSLLDGFANIVGLVGLHYAFEPPDPGHPYGHRRVENLAATGVGVLVLFGVVEVGRGAWQSYIGQHLPRTDVGGLLVILGTLIVNVGVTWWERRKGRALHSSFLEADALHTLSDVFATVLVLASYAGAHAKIPWADPAAAGVVMVLIARTGLHILRENVPVLLDAAAIDPERVREIVEAIPGVAGCHKIRSRGPARAVELDLHIQVEPSMSVLDGHWLSHRVKDGLVAKLPNVQDVLVHIEPDIPEERRLKGEYER